MTIIAPNVINDTRDNNTFLPVLSIQRPTKHILWAIEKSALVANYKQASKHSIYDTSPQISQHSTLNRTTNPIPPSSTSYRKQPPDLPASHPSITNKLHPTHPSPTSHRKLPPYNISIPRYSPEYPFSPHAATSSPAPSQTPH